MNVPFSNGCRQTLHITLTSSQVCLPFYDHIRTSRNFYSHCSSRSAKQFTYWFYTPILIFIALRNCLLERVCSGREVPTAGFLIPLQAYRYSKFPFFSTQKAFEERQDLGKESVSGVLDKNRTVLLFSGAESSLQGRSMKLRRWGSNGDCAYWDNEQYSIPVQICCGALTDWGVSYCGLISMALRLGGEMSIKLLLQSAEIYGKWERKMKSQSFVVVPESFGWLGGHKYNFLGDVLVECIMRRWNCGSSNLLLLTCHSNNLSSMVIDVLFHCFLNSQLLHCLKK